MAQPLKRPHPPARQGRDSAPPAREGGRGDGGRRGGQGGGGAAPGMLYGVHPVTAAWLNPERRCRRLLVTAAGRESVAGALAEARSRGLDRPQPTPVERADLDRLLPPGAVHQGVALDAAPLPELGVDDVIRVAESAALPACVVVLDQVTDPHNVGAILRSASAFGALAVVVTERHAPEVTGVLAKSASGALESVPLLRVTNLARALEELQQGGFWCVGFDESGARRVAELDLSGRTALVMGAEGAGLRRLTRERCDEIVRLPTGGPVGSLNVSNAAAVALYEVARRRD
ncbi:23S rRNA (guanosine(2251)-2'-O)-methyltransferase RlmB [Azospirillum sp. RWY-5-1]|uniref:23S rRNA (Guanosine(2251)-2'-O)-methyltransferase RlmB n=1 Tax=Azospirillum oleiclasticum TaxID=2735135 RepID=A0ABX2TB23_9PROT|nr:23S rRNA (guanosine(2251)-2'-O)-methyltransferase RlmB [Azospirillum oleiclasticum]NYZ13276.1 23S rRNA (guanosine(2251)-2'-O)-methyltransferase RlmB [Azospirillum oleiclasticum]NYZ20437.1 23S rRNA (guanosine(2251)-2'-O)-methyltransferase RlmB [Azospirillum oleiclasticum]